jgi:2-polyprenyl-3-methyl-5-hydroxy-6-metoxy-1,4-benzoquinol methylase
VAERERDSTADRSTFNYESIPNGYYDLVLRNGNPIRRLWHVSKFERVLDYLPEQDGGALLDVGCFAGTFLSMVPRYRFERQVGIDILPGQIEYANHNHASPFRSFHYVPKVTALKGIGEPFDWITCIEVIEHLKEGEIRALFERFTALLAPKGSLVLTTPNYASTWPLLEAVLNRVSDVSYEEQHICKFDVFRFEKQLARIVPGVWSDYRLAMKTTTHFLTPFLAAGSFDIARGLSRVVPHQKWSHPFGNLMLAVLEKKQ